MLLKKKDRYGKADDEAGMSQKTKVVRRLQPGILLKIQVVSSGEFTSPHGGVKSPLPDVR